MSDRLVALDSGPSKDSLSIAEARHVVRERMLLEALDACHEIGMNPENRAADRVSALRVVIEFAEAAEGSEGKLLTRLRPEVARRLARIGKEQDDKAAGIAKRLTTGPEEDGPAVDSKG